MAESRPILTNFDGRGHGERVRMMLVAANVEWKDARFVRTRADMLKLLESGKLEFGQLPMLEWDGVYHVESKPIVRMIARKYHLDGNTEAEKFQVDMLAESARDFNGHFMGFGLSEDDTERYKNVREIAIPKYMPVFDKRLAPSRSGFLVGSEMTEADVSLFEVLLHVEERAPEAFDKYSNCKALLEKMKAEPNFKAYLSGPQRRRAPCKAYFDEVKAALAW